MIVLRQATPGQNVPLGPFVDATDGFTLKTALTIGNADIAIWYPGAVDPNHPNSGLGATHVYKGQYLAVLDAVDTAAAGSAKIYVTPTGARPMVDDLWILPASIFDSFTSVTELFSVGNISAGAWETMATNAKTAILDSVLLDHNDPGTVGYGINLAAGGGLTVPAASEVALAVWAAQTAISTTPGSFGESVGGAFSPQALAQAVLDLLKRVPGFPSTGIARGGSANTIQIASDANVATTWAGMMVSVFSPTGTSQSLGITNADPVSKVLTVNGLWRYVPVAGTPYAVIAQ